MAALKVYSKRVKISNSEVMTLADIKWAETSCLEFVQALASKNPVPGGGGEAALCGALGVALGNMVIQLTLGKKRYAEYEEINMQLAKEFALLQQELLLLVDKDAEEFAPLAAAYGIKAVSDEEKASKKVILQNALRQACVVPLQIARLTNKAIRLHAKLAETGSSLAISDVACGIQTLRAALLSARVNVLINLTMIDEKEYQQEVFDELDLLCKEAITIADTVFTNIDQSFTGKL